MNFQVIHIENNSNTPIKTVIIPDNALVLAIQSGSPVYEITSDKKVMLPKIHMCGPLTHVKRYEREPGSRTTLVKFKPWALGLHLHGIRDTLNRNIDYHDLSIAKDFLNDERQLDVISLFESIFQQNSIDKTILQSINIITEERGHIRVDELADQVCNSKRNFERKFREATGLTPKEFIRNSRFNYSLKLMASRDSLTEVSYESGYYDQSHFILDFKNITGVSPEKYSGVIKPIENWAKASKVYH